MSVEVRRVQKLGASSLVVTIPKEWARRLGIEPGSRVYVVDEGDSIRVIPVDHGSGEAPALEVPPQASAAGNLVVCVYLSGLSEAEVRLRGPGDPDAALMAMKEKAFNLLGAQVVEAGEGRAFIRVALDMDKLDLGHLIRGLSSDASKVLSLLARIIEQGGVSEADLREAELLERDFLRNQYAITRYLMTKHAGTVSLVSNYYTALATGYIGFAVDILINLVRVLPERVEIGEDDARGLLDLIGMADEAILVETRVLASPSMRRIGELLLRVREARDRAREAMLGARSAAAAIIGAKLHDVIRILTLSAYVALCRTLIEAAKGRRG
ncbi:MAG: AbrB/MazE/SpoVT family DNA-binding domain-containing protein [Desulfurococcales archaeon]|nr:AbrB/MazE/SpoVT family DNA-binding domain-containing protein [Desulfurococcales archaeon]